MVTSMVQATARWHYDDTRRKREIRHASGALSGVSGKEVGEVSEPDSKGTSGRSHGRLKAKLCLTGSSDKR